MKKNFYEELGLNKNATKNEIKSSYRSLVKKHHPDAGGKEQRFLEIQTAWETLNDPKKKEEYDQQLFSLHTSSSSEFKENWEEKINSKKYNSSTKDKEVKAWIEGVFNPSNRLITQIIKPLNNEIKELSADPYDDKLMEKFCDYIELSQKKIKKVEKIYNSILVPNSIIALGLDLYHCYSQVQDALAEIDRYTQGYVDDYLFDGKEMMKEAKRIQSTMICNKKNKIS
tara:strand:+ start:112 stop:792 length:681 start_codon:yes stop_codon:yes gene_type:complete